MAASFFFYDLETSGIDPRKSRIMQFAGQRTDMNLKPIGEPVNQFITLTPDILPDLEAILLTGITPQQSIMEGITEASFLKQFYDEVVQPDTVFLGFNSIRFDDEFMRFLHWRNFYDAYEWQWQNSCSRWDLLDVVRMTRALRPDGIKWPYASNGKPSNRLELLTSINKLTHNNAHDALGDVYATIEVAKLIQSNQPELFKYLLSVRGKKAVAKLVDAGQPFVYTSGHFSSDYLHTSPVVKLCDHPQNDAALVYDLRFNPTEFLDMNTSELVETWRYTKDPDAKRLPVKTMKYNRCPAVAPLGVINNSQTEGQLQVSLSEVKDNLQILKKHQNTFSDAILLAVEQLDEERELTQSALLDNPLYVDEKLYDGFVSSNDKNLMRDVRNSQTDQFYEIGGNFVDQRLQNLLPLYKARNFPKTLDPEERTNWDTFCKQKLLAGGSSSRAAQYFNNIQEKLVETPDKKKQYILEELRLYGESILPVDVAD